MSIEMACKTCSKSVGQRKERRVLQEKCIVLLLKWQDMGKLKPTL